MTSIFISYSRKDRNAIDEILATIADSSLKTWLDERDILPTMEFNARILDGLDKSDWYLLVMTPRSAKSEYVKDELHWALTNRDGRIIPVMLEKCDPATFHLRMMRIQYVDWTSGSHTGKPQLQNALQLVKDITSDGTLPLNDASLDSEKELIGLLLTFITRHHQKHIRNLKCDRWSSNQNYMGCRNARRELRDLCGWGILKRIPGIKLGESENDGQRFILSDIVELTPIGESIVKHIV